MKTIEGEASVTIRKQKQIFLFEFEMEIYFEAKQVSDPSKSCKGKVKVRELNQDDDECDLEVTQEKPGDFIATVRKTINKTGGPAIHTIFMGLSQAMRDKDADENKLKKD